MWVFKVIGAGHGKRKEKTITLLSPHWINSGVIFGSLEI